MKLPVLLLFWFKRKRHLGFIPRAYFATADHNYNQHKPLPLTPTLQLRALEENSKEYGISHWGLETKNGIVHVVGPETELPVLLFAEIHILPPTVPLVPGLVLLR
jgi:homoaconitase/3-isopropylmalate dehydratase large subunit